MIFLFDDFTSHTTPKAHGFILVQDPITSVLCFSRKARCMMYLGVNLNEQTLLKGCWICQYVRANLIIEMNDWVLAAGKSCMLHVPAPVPLFIYGYAPAFSFVKGSTF
jgi:hypothetical protein